MDHFHLNDYLFSGEGLLAFPRKNLRQNLVYSTQLSFRVGTLPVRIVWSEFVETLRTNHKRLP